jgi:hypothetical protein
MSTQTRDIATLTSELNYLARQDVHDFNLGLVPILCLAVSRLNAKPPPCTRQDVQRAIEAGIRAIAADDDRTVLLGEWVFGIPAEAHKDKLTGRQKTVGRILSRSDSSIRQTDQPDLIKKLVADFFVSKPDGFLHAADRTVALPVDDRVGYRVRHIVLALDLNPGDYHLSRITAAFEIEAIRRSEYFCHTFTLDQGQRHDLTVRSRDSRLKLLPVGHPLRPSEDRVCYRLDPPYAPDERGVIRFRQRQMGRGRHTSLLDPLTRGVVVASESVESLELSITTPAHRDFHPLWFESDGFVVLQQGEISRTHKGKRSQRFTIAISDPREGHLYGIYVDEPLPARAREYRCTSVLTPV